MITLHLPKVVILGISFICIESPVSLWKNKRPDGPIVIFAKLSSSLPGVKIILTAVSGFKARRFPKAVSIVS